MWNQKMTCEILVHNGQNLKKSPWQRCGGSHRAHLWCAAWVPLCVGLGTGACTVWAEFAKLSAGMMPFAEVRQGRHPAGRWEQPALSEGSQSTGTASWVPQPGQERVNLPAFSAACVLAGCGEQHGHTSSLRPHISSRSGVKVGGVLVGYGGCCVLGCTHITPLGVCVHGVPCVTNHVHPNLNCTRNIISCTIWVFVAWFISLLWFSTVDSSKSVCDFLYLFILRKKLSMKWPLKKKADVLPV